jgi:PAS domain S-box-containing protein
MKTDNQTDTVKLRRRAEKHLQSQPHPAKASSPVANPQRLHHELQVYQIELEMQNEELRRAKDDLETALARYTDLYNFAPTGYFTLGPESDIRQINIAGAKFLGVERSRLANRRLTTLVSAQDRTVFTAFLERAFQSMKKEVCEVELFAVDKRVLQVRLEAVVSPEKQECRVVMVDITDHKKALELNRLLNAELEQRVRQRTATIRKLATELTLAEQRERSRLSHVLHDHLQQLIIGAIYLLQGVQNQVPPKEQKRIKKVKKILAQSADVARDLAVELSPPVLRNEGLTAVLSWLGQWMRENHGLTVKVQSSPEQTPLPEELSVIVFQVVRELLFNVIKHAEVKSATVTMERLNGQLIVVVSDNGVGFDPAAHQSSDLSPDGFGLFATRERLALLNGLMEIDSAPKQGSRITLRVPLTRSTADLLSKKKEL